MTVFAKLTKARAMLQEQKLQKTGKNTFAKYSYFELGDFLPQTVAIFDELGLCSSISFDAQEATMEIMSVEKEGGVITIKTPLFNGAMKGTHPMQSWGAVLTYARRYLWMEAMCVSEADGLDAAAGSAVSDEPPAVIGAKDVENLQGLISATGADLGKFLSHYNVQEIAKLPITKLAHATAALTKKLGGDDAE